MRLRRGSDPDLIVRLPDGSHAAVAASSTDYAGPSTAPSLTAPPALLDLAGLRRLAELVAHLRTPGDPGDDTRVVPESCSPQGHPLPWPEGR